MDLTWARQGEVEGVDGRDEYSIRLSITHLFFSFTWSVRRQVAFFGLVLVKTNSSQVKPCMMASLTSMHLGSAQAQAQPRAYNLRNVTSKPLSELETWMSGWLFRLFPGMYGLKTHRNLMISLLNNNSDERKRRDEPRSMCHPCNQHPGLSDKQNKKQMRAKFQAKKRKKTTVWKKRMDLISANELIWESLVLQLFFFRGWKWADRAEERERERTMRHG